MKNKAMFYYIIAITALVAMAASSFAYFYSEITGTTTSSNIITANIGRVEYVTNNPSPSDNIFPGWEGVGSTSVYFVSSSDVDVYYQCTVALTDDSIEDNVYVRALSGTDGALTSETKVTREGIVVSSGKLDAQSNIIAPGTGVKHNVSYTLIYREQGSAQNEEQGHYIKTSTTCTLQNDKFSSLNLVSGQITDLSGDPIANQAMAVFSSPRYFVTDSLGYYSVFLEEGQHSVYYVPGYTLEQTRNAGETIKQNSEALTKNVTVSESTSEEDIVFNINAPIRRITLVCNNCEGDSEYKDVAMLETAQFTITPNTGYSLTGATYSSNCSFSSGVLSITAGSSDETCTITLQAKGITCSSGKYLPANSETCENCTAGNYCSGWSGTYDALEHGLSSCSDLGSNYTSDANSNSASDCYINVAGGKYKTSANGNTTQNCQQGSYQTAHKSYYGSADTCQACTGGKTNTAGNTSCTSTCSNSSGVSTWKTTSWSNGTVSNLCAAKTCSDGYSISGSDCVTAITYVYWDKNFAGTSTYTSTTVPSSTAASVTDLNLGTSTSYPYIRTKMQGTTVMGHEVCIYYKSTGKSFCGTYGDYSSYLSSGIETLMNQLQSNISSQSGVSTSCTKSSSSNGNSATCGLTTSSNYCKWINNNNTSDLRCVSPSRTCMVYSTGAAKCS